MKDLQAYINDLLTKAKGGDEKALLMLYTRMCTFLTAIHMTKYVSNNLQLRNDVDDIKQEYYFRFVSSLTKFDTTLNKTFISYQKTVIENVIKDFYQNQKSIVKYKWYERGMRITSLDEILDDVENIYQPSHTNTPELIFESLNDVKMAHELLDNILTPLQKYVWVEWTTKDKTLQQLAEELYTQDMTEKIYTRERIRQIYTKADNIVKKLRK